MVFLGTLSPTSNFVWHEQRQDLHWRRGPVRFSSEFLSRLNGFWLIDHKKIIVKIPQTYLWIHELFKKFNDLFWRINELSRFKLETCIADSWCVNCTNWDLIRTLCMMTCDSLFEWHPSSALTGSSRVERRWNCSVDATLSSHSLRRKWVILLKRRRRSPRLERPKRRFHYCIPSLKSVLSSVWLRFEDEGKSWIGKISFTSITCLSSISSFFIKKRIL